MDYFKKLYPKRLLSGDMGAVHNAIRQAYAMNDYLSMVRKHQDFDTVTVSATMDDGFCLSYRHRVPSYQFAFKRIPSSTVGLFLLDVPQGTPAQPSPRLASVSILNANWYDAGPTQRC